MPGAPFRLKPGERFPFILARDLGMTVEQMSQSLDYAEYVQWLALYEVEGEEQQRAMKRAQGGNKG